MGAIVLFDGVCNFCNSLVNFVIEHDRDGYFKFAPLQSDEGRRLATQSGYSMLVTGDDALDKDVRIDSVILIEKGRVFTHSTAALEISKRLGVPWSLLYAFIVVPKGIRDYFYKLFARYRYRLFGRKDRCMLPSPEVRERFLT
ncbi:MAG: thiol-disulfide oxidoreductase DCC family protein [Pyrinomonadaceae bacterium]